MNEQILIERLKKRDKTVYDDILNLYAKLIWTVAYGVLKDVGTFEDVEEICADTMIHLWQYPEKYNDEKSSLKTYLCIVTKHKAIDRLRKLKRMKESVLEDDYADDGIETLFMQRELLKQVYEEANQLKEPDREIFILRYFYQLKPKEIGLKLSMSAKTIQNILYQAKKHVVHALKGVIDE